MHSKTSVHMNKTTVYFNPECSKCNLVRALLEQHNIEPEIIHYLDSPLLKDQLTRIIHLGVAAKDLIRTHEQAWLQTGLNIETAADDDLINAIIQYPALLQRPIVVTGGRAVIARPPEKILEIL